MSKRTKSRKHFAQNNAHPDLSVLAGGVAVISGGAAGIGFALAQRAINGGINVAIADIGAQFLGPAEEKLEAAAARNGVRTWSCVCDVTSEDSVRSFAVGVERAFPGLPISLLCCNAGVVGGGKGVIFSSQEDWMKMLGPNTFGVMNFIRVFVPGMMTQDAPGAVELTASLAAVSPGGGLYGVSKHACLSLGESLYSEVRGRLSVQVLCPEIVRSGLNSNIPGFNALGMQPSRCAAHVFDSIQRGNFYTFVDNEEDPGLVAKTAKARAEGMYGGDLSGPAPRSDDLVGRPKGFGSKFLQEVFTRRGETKPTTAQLLEKGGQHTTQAELVDDHRSKL